MISTPSERHGLMWTIRQKLKHFQKGSYEKKIIITAILSDFLLNEGDKNVEHKSLTKNFVTWSGVQKSLKLLSPVLFILSSIC